MSEERKPRCPECNAPYTAGAKTCRSCGKTLPSAEQIIDSETLEGMPVKDWHTFIGKNSDYYVRTFKKHEGKGFFLSLNPCAFIFGTYWFLYRKIYKAAIITYALSLAFVLFFAIIGIFIHTPEISLAAADCKAYSAYITLDGERTDQYPETESPLKTEIDNAYFKYRRAVNSATTSSVLMGLLGSVVGTIFTPLLGNWFYREYILNNTVRKKGYVANSGNGGTSLVAPVFLYLVGESVILLVLYVISIIALFIISGI